ncbi:MAG: energy transducer TonB [Acidobacteria bacterium]|nr:energy transducer TonB [Acidobacteriota bacterium]
MPVNVRRFCTSVLLILGALAAFTNAQTVPPATPENTASPVVTPVKTATSAEIMRERISKAKAFIAVRNYNAAIYELENIRRETSDPSVQAVTTVLLMNSYLEQGDYKRAQDFLTQAFNTQKANKPGAADIYNAIAGQVIKGARTKVERYKSLGLVIADRNLPLEAINDIERMRETLELVITQAKENGKETGKANTAMALLEEATTSRSMVARDDYDAKRWKDEVADSREQIANSRSVITNAVDGTTSPNVAPPQIVAANNPPLQMPPQPVSGQPLVTKIVDSRPVNSTSLPPPTTAAKPNDRLVAASEKPVIPDQPKIEQPKKEEPPKRVLVPNPSSEKPEPQEPSKQSGPAAETPKTDGPLDVGPLIGYATKQSTPVYPAAAKSMRSTGVVRVEVTIDESGEVAEVQKTSGPPLLQTAAKDAVRKWKFKPFTRDGQPVRAIGFVNFNFAL